MAEKELLLALAKVMIAAAWLDGAISEEEYASLRQWLSPLQIGAHEWARLEMYLSSPVDELERERLTKELANLLASTGQKQQVREALQDIIQADGQITQTEQELYETVTQAIDRVNVTALGRLGRTVRQAVARRQDAAATAPNREQAFEEFVRNRVYYRVCERLGQDNLDLSEAELRRLSLAGGLLARVAHVDQQIAASETEAMVQALQLHWGVSAAAATFITEIALTETEEGLDYYQLVDGFRAVTSEAERVRFLDALFAVAHADQTLFHEESEQIRRIARGLGLSREQFMQARVGRGEG
ncbi:MAG: TerB family tellurite resistance protein [Anaerolineae bacterium]|nr:TerB family tellurite resistance protein [Anaerolineae bacterium]